MTQSRNHLPRPASPFARTTHTTGEEHERDEVVKGYKYERGRFLTFTAEELKALDRPVIAGKPVCCCRANDHHPMRFQLLSMVPEGDPTRMPEFGTA